MAAISKKRSTPKVAKALSKQLASKPGGKANAGKPGPANGGISFAAFKQEIGVPSSGTAPSIQKKPMSVKAAKPAVNNKKGGAVAKSSKPGQVRPNSTKAKK